METENRGRVWPLKMAGGGVDTRFMVKKRVFMLQVEPFLDDDSPYPPWSTVSEQRWALHSCLSGMRNMQRGVHNLSEDSAMIGGLESFCGGGVHIGLVLILFNWVVFFSSCQWCHDKHTVLCSLLTIPSISKRPVCWYEYEGVSQCGGNWSSKIILSPRLRHECEGLWGCRWQKQFQRYNHHLGLQI